MGGESLTCLQVMMEGHIEKKKKPFETLLAADIVIHLIGFK